MHLPWFTSRTSTWVNLDIVEQLACGPPPWLLLTLPCIFPAYQTQSSWTVSHSTYFKKAKNLLNVLTVTDHIELRLQRSNNSLFIQIHALSFKQHLASLVIMMACSGMTNNSRKSYSTADWKTQSTHGSSCSSNGESRCISGHLGRLVTQRCLRQQLCHFPFVHELLHSYRPPKLKTTNSIHRALSLLLGLVGNKFHSLLCCILLTKHQEITG